MTLYELIQNHEFDSIVPHLTAIDPENVPHNLYAFKEAFDDLRRRSPGDSGGEQIVVTTHVDTDNDDNELERYLHASHCEGAAWDACLAKDVIFGSAIGEEEALAQILWHMTFLGFSTQADPLESLPENEYKRKVKEFERKGKIQRLIDRIMYASPGYALCPENRKDGILSINPAAEEVTPQRFRYLFDTAEITLDELYSRTVLKDGRASYISKNIADYYTSDPAKYTKAIVLLETSEEHPLRIGEFKPLQASIERITGHCGHTCLLFGKNPDLGHDIHILIALSR